jgi:hypothetical protein
MKFQVNLTENVISKCHTVEERTLGTPKSTPLTMNAPHDLPTLMPLCQSKICVGAVLQKG